MFKLHSFAVVVVLGLIGLSAGSAAPKSAETPTEKRDKGVTEFVGRVLGAIGRQDIETLADLSDVPFDAQQGEIVKTKAGLKEALKKALFGKEFDGRMHKVLEIQSFKEARARFTDKHAKEASIVLGDDDLVVRVEVLEKRGSSQGRLLIRTKDGKLRLVGTQVETDDK